MPSVVGAGRNVRLRALLCCVLLFSVPATSLAGCSVIEAVRRPVPTPTPAPEVTLPAPVTPPSPRLPDRFEKRTVGVPVPDDHTRAAVEFADATRGAALYVRCATKGCTGRLLVTADGGRSWQERQHPGGVAESQQLYLGPDGTLVLLAEPRGWFVSRDAGLTFQRLPYSRRPPAEYQALRGPYQICCDSDARPRLVRWENGRSVDVPPPGLPGQLASVAVRGGRELWTASIDAAQPYTAASTDEGRTWTRYEVPGAGGGLRSLDVKPSSDGGDLWLVGVGEDQLLPPALWRFDGAGWRQVGAAGRPRSSRAAVPVGAGLLATTGAAGTGVLSDRYTPLNWPWGGWMSLLGDGTLRVDDYSDTFIWLGTGTGVDRQWARLDLRQPKVARPR